MKNAFLVATREYAENARTKGFWIGIFLFPVILIGMMKVPRLLEKKATPTRHFILVDQSGEMRETVVASLESHHRRNIAQELFAYIKKYAKVSQKTAVPDLEKLPADSFDPEKMLEDRGVSMDSIAEALGGVDLEAYLEKSSSFLQEDRPPFEKPKPRFVEVPLPDGVSRDQEPKDLVAALKPYLLGEKKIRHGGEGNDLFALIVIPEEVDRALIRPFRKSDPSSISQFVQEKPRGVEYWCTNLADDELPKLVERSLNEEIRVREYLARKISKEEVQEVQGTKLAFSSLNPKKEKGKEAVSLADKIRQWAPVGFVYVLWISIFTIAGMLLNNTVEEKSNRIVEVLLSSVTPGELMGGKLLGIAAVGLTMLSAWMLALLGVLHFHAQEEKELVSAFFEVLQGSGLLPAFVFYFLFGYLMYGGIFLSLGSLCNTVKEAQNLMGPVMIILIVPLATMAFIPKDPNGTLASLLSWVPIYTPFIMMNRAAADPPMFDVVGTVILMVFSTVAILWLSGKIFRIGILRTGQPPKILELFRWLRGSA